MSKPAIPEHRCRLDFDERREALVCSYGSACRRIPLVDPGRLPSLLRNLAEQNVLRGRAELEAGRNGVSYGR